MQTYPVLKVFDLNKKAVEKMELFKFCVFAIYRLAPGNEETAYMLLQTCIGIVGAVFSPVGVVCVYIL